MTGNVLDRILKSATALVLLLPPCLIALHAPAEVKELASVPLDGWPQELALSGDGSLAVVAQSYGTGLQFFRLPNLDLVDSISTPSANDRIISVDLNATGTLVVFGTWFGGVYLMNRSLDTIAEVRAPIPIDLNGTYFDGSSAVSVAISPDESKLAATIDDIFITLFDDVPIASSTLHIFDAGTREEMGVFPSTCCNADIQFLQDSVSIVSASGYTDDFVTSGTVLLVDLMMASSTKLLSYQADLGQAPKFPGVVSLFGDFVCTPMGVLRTAPGTEPVPPLCNGCSLQYAAFSSHGDYILGHDGSNINIYRDGTLIRTYAQPFTLSKAWGGIADGTVIDVGSPKHLLVLAGSDPFRLVYLEDSSWGQIAGEGESVNFLGVDQNQDNKVDLSELLRLVQIFNSGGYHCDPAGEDGYGPGGGDTGCAPFNSDYAPQDWKISMSELLRLIQLYNVGGYYNCVGGEDGFCPAIALP